MSLDEPAGFLTSANLNHVATSSSIGLPAPNHKRTYQVRGSLLLTDPTSIWLKP